MHKLDFKRSTKKKVRRDTKIKKERESIYIIKTKIILTIDLDYND